MSNKIDLLRQKAAQRPPPTQPNPNHNPTSTKADALRAKAAQGVTGKIFGFVNRGAGRYRPAAYLFMGWIFLSSGITLFYMKDFMLFSGNFFGFGAILSMRNQWEDIIYKSNRVFTTRDKAAIIYSFASYISFVACFFSKSPDSWKALPVFNMAIIYLFHFKFD